MSFFGGSNNTPGFGGFGNSNTGGFGASNNNTTTNAGSLFGANTSTAGGFGGGGFGSSGGAGGFNPPKPNGFGATNTATTGGSLFGGGTGTSGSGFGGFGATNNQTSGGFGGAANTGGGLFGQPKAQSPGFGAPNAGGSLFGGGNTASGGFGSTNANTGFGGTNTGAGFGSNNAASGGFSFGTAAASAGNNNNGTAGTPYNAMTEKDGSTSQSICYMPITFQSPYKAKSFEELRVEDYAQGRRFGNSNGQAGSFGQSTGFGGFGSNSNAAGSGGGLFGANSAAGSASGGLGGFGTANNNNTSAGFGATNTNTTGGGLFGSQPKQPASGGLFGAAQSSGAATSGFGGTAGSGGGVFGSGTGFGSNNTTNNNMSGVSLFGGASSQPQVAKPAFGGFGAGATGASSGGFGGNASSAFGNSSNNAGAGSFGQGVQQQSNPFGAPSNPGGGLFGQQQAKPAAGSVFGGNANTGSGGGLFGTQNNQQQQSGGLFGSSGNAGGGLFGQQNQNKPAPGGLFGASLNNTNGQGGNLFGGQPNQPQQGGGLFGASANQGSSLFGNDQNKTGTGLFGSNNTNANNNPGGGSSLFGSNQQVQQNTGSSLFGGMNQANANNANANQLSRFGGSLGNSAQQPQQNQLHASLTGAPYGNEQLFSSLAAPSPPIGPLATPLSGAQTQPRKTSSLLASARMNTPVYSPRGSVNRSAGYGFSYSTYGTPGSAYTSGSLTPGSLLKPTGSLSSALTSRLNKSLSTSNLRGESTPSEGRSLLRPNAFTPNGGTGGYFSGNVRKLKIDRSLRTDLFGSSQPLAIEGAKDKEGSLNKSVSFDHSADREPAANSSNALARIQEPVGRSSGPDRDTSLARPLTNSAPEMEQVNGTLTTVPEETEPPRRSSAPVGQPPSEKNKDVEGGEYWSKPAMKDLKKMSRQQLKNVGNFSVGREGFGYIEFGSVDLTNTPLEDICGNIVQFSPRKAIVYDDDATKPIRGQALNVPSTIHLEQTWPRSHAGKRAVTAKNGKELERHIARLKRVSGTRFIDYNVEDGVWTFKVEHFTEYGLEDDESEYFDESQMQAETSGLSEPPDIYLADHPMDLSTSSGGAVRAPSASCLGESYLAQKSAKKYPSKAKASDESQAFTSAMDLMQSIWSEPQGKHFSTAVKDFEFPYPKKQRLFANDEDPRICEWHKCMKPSFTTASGILAYKDNRSAPLTLGGLIQGPHAVDDGRDQVRFTKFGPTQHPDHRSLDTQKMCTVVELANNFPIVKTQRVEFGYMLKPAASNDRSEIAIWQMCSILFDSLITGCGKLVRGVPPDQLKQLESRIRKDTFGIFWSEKVVSSLVEAGVKRARSPEEKALQLLTGNELVRACKELSDAGNFKLANLLSQRPFGEASKKIMRDQIKVWCDRNDWSEMSNATRALYSVLAGDFCVVAGKYGAAEDRAPEFKIAENFELGWQQSFALRLYYGDYQQIVEVVQAYMADLQNGQETVRPSRISASGAETNDTLMELLAFFAGASDPVKLFEPMSVSGNAFDSRMAWQMANLFRASGQRGLTDEQLDRLSMNLVAELESCDEFLTAVWVTLQINDNVARETAIVALLERNAAEFSDAQKTPLDLDVISAKLLNYYHIPEVLIWRARALWAAGVGDAAAQASHLLRAGDGESAHAILCSVVGPRAVIEQDYTALAGLLDCFASHPIVTGWHVGGQVYQHFLRLTRASSGESEGEKEAQAALKGLRKGLAGTVAGGGQPKGLEERVARIEMSRIADEVARKRGDEFAPVAVKMGTGVLGGNVSGTEMLAAWSKAMGAIS